MNRNLIKDLLRIPLLLKPPPVGGQAIIEGVMMRGPRALSMAVRRMDGEIVCKTESFTSLTKKYKALGWPVIRGFIQLFESLKIGLRALNYSADIAMEEKPSEGEKKKTWKDAAAMGLTITLSFAVAMLFFMYLPLLLSSLIDKDMNPFLFNVVAGAFRMTFFLIYLAAISLMKDIRRVFEYHGAEHKAIFTYEAEKELTVDNTKEYATHHPRCGTSFLLIVALVCILLFALIDGLITTFIGPYPSVLYRFLVHFALIPLVSGVSYEILKASDKTKNNPVIGLLILPGLWLQRITTKNPDDQQVEVAITALKAVL